MSNKQALVEMLIQVSKLPQEEKEAWARELTDEQREYISRYVLYGELCRLDDTPQAFGAFYELVYRKRLPKHAMSWVVDWYKAREEGKGVVVQAFRGSTKTTTVTAFTAFRIGKEPHKANMLIQVGDDIAQDNTGAVADIIANNPGWKLAFPYIEPDREKGWGAGGYEVKRTDIDYSDWRELNAARKDPTLIGLSYKSRAIIGKHPDGLLVIDDIHDENNTSSLRELNTVISILTGTIFPTMTDTTWPIFIGTPWVDGDALDYVEQTGEYESIKTPVLTWNETGEYEFEGQRCDLAWPDIFSLAVIASKKKLSGEREFARMYLLDLEASHVDGVRFLPYPAHHLDPYTMPIAGGCDPAFVYEERALDPKDRSFNAIVWLAKAKDIDCLVIFDGIVERSTFAEVERNLWKLQNLYPKTCIGTWFETAGRGQDQYYSVMLRNPGLKLIPSTTGGKKVGPKVEKTRRHEVELFPWLENGKIRVSDADTPFLNHVREALKKWPYFHLDIIDGIYQAAKAFPETLVITKNTSTGLPPADEYTKPPADPWAKLFSNVKTYAR